MGVSKKLDLAIGDYHFTEMAKKVKMNMNWIILQDKFAKSP